jgi:hypothetical protein
MDIPTGTLISVSSPSLFTNVTVIFSAFGSGFAAAEVDNGLKTEEPQTLV